MPKNTFNFKSFARFLKRNKLYTAINLFGFSVSLMFVILITAYVTKELSADRHHANRERIYRIENQDFAYSAYPFGQILKDRFPEIDSYCTVAYESRTIKHGDEYMNVTVDCVDSSFFNIFTVPLLQGDPSQALAARNGVVIHEGLAKTLFGGESPIGKELVLDDRKISLTVTGVFSDFKYGIFYTPQMITSIYNSSNNGCLPMIGCHSWELFLMARPNADLPSKIEQIRLCLKETGDFSFSRDEKAVLTPLKDIFFDGFHFQNGGNKKFVNILLAVGLAILIFAVINYINLSVAQTSFRAREMATRRLLGGTRWQLFANILSESILLSAFSFILGILLATAAENTFNNLINTSISIPQALNPYTIVGSLAFIVLLGIVSGFVPATVISNFKPIEVMSGAFRARTKMVYSKILIVFQYVITIILIGCTFTMIRQIRFMTHYDMGYGSEALIQVDMPGNTIASYAPLKNELMKISGVEAVSFSLFSPTSGGNNNTDPSDPDHAISYQVFMGDTSYIRVCKFEIVHDNGLRGDNQIWLNEEAIKANGLNNDAAEFKLYQQPTPIAGVLRDFRFRDMSMPVGPAMVRTISSDSYCNSTLIRINMAGNPTETFARINQVVERYMEGRPFSGGFASQQIQNWYRNQQRTAETIGYLTLIAILIAALGILAISAYYIRQRATEIAVRKVYGSTNREVLARLIANFMRMVAIGFVVAVPVTWYVMRQWLDHYTERIPLSWYIFAFAGLVAAAIAFVTVYWQSRQAANTNPVDSLKK